MFALKFANPKMERGLDIAQGRGRQGSYSSARASSDLKLHIAYIASNMWATGVDWDIVTNFAKYLFTPQNHGLSSATWHS